ncbi:FecR domain-containing protein [Crocinitomicaceae bacterium]|nr:FecR domain-containing protein [Crocinitomicaceae bacterium]MDC0257231.1 FecR domain-containing protein [Crocinitomicaceae bacterium]
MAEEKDISDELLGRWLAGELTEDERIAFEQSEAFQSYQVIAEYSDQLEVGSFDTDAAYKRLKDKRSAPPKAKIIGIPRSRFLAVAASVLVLIGLGSMFFLGDAGVENTTISVANGERMNVTLPDNSSVALNANSSIVYNKGKWKEERNVKLEGEALFKVKKGKRFRVTTKHGTVEVLGTQFNVLDRNERTEVVCYTGKVLITDSKGKSTILTKGMAARMNKGVLAGNWKPEINDKPDWQLGYSTFENVPLQDVLDELEAQYAIDVNVKANISGRTYHGAFPHDNLDQALALIFGPMQLNYTKENGVIVVVE